MDSDGAFPEGKVSDLESDHYPPLVPKLRIFGVKPPFHFIPSRKGF
jgi:hypothetical protein